MPLPSKKEIEASFDKKITKHKWVFEDFSSIDKNLDYIKEFIHETRISDLSAIIEWVKFQREPVNKQIVVEKDEEILEYLIGKRNAYNDVLAHLTSLQKDL